MSQTPTDPRAESLADKVATVIQEMRNTPASSYDIAQAILRMGCPYAELERIRGIMADPEKLRSHTVRAFPDWVWDTAEHYALLRHSAEQLAALSANGTRDK